MWNALRTQLFYDAQKVFSYIIINGLYTSDQQTDSDKVKPNLNLQLECKAM